MKNFFLTLILVFAGASCTHVKISQENRNPDPMSVRDRAPATQEPVEEICKPMQDRIENFRGHPNDGYDWMMKGCEVIGEVTGMTPEDALVQRLTWERGSGRRIRNLSLKEGEKDLCRNTDIVMFPVGTKAELTIHYETTNGDYSASVSSKSKNARVIGSHVCVSLEYP